MRDKVENLVQDIAGIVQDFQISRDPSLTQVELVEMLADGMILTLDEA
jgi:hypothetical protein